MNDDGVAVVIEAGVQVQSRIHRHMLARSFLARYRAAALLPLTAQ